VGSAAEEKGGFREVGVEFAVAGGEDEGLFGHRRGGFDGGEIGLQGVICVGGGLVAERHGGAGEPEIESGVGTRVREGGEAFGEAQGGAVEAGAGGGFRPGAEAAKEAEAVVRRLLGHRLDLYRGVAAKAAEKDCQPSAYL
jgi:hypothetical protein